MRKELADALACTLMQTIDDFEGSNLPGIPVGETSHIVEVQYEEGEEAVGIRVQTLEGSETWELLLFRNNPTADIGRSWAHMTPDERTEAIAANVQRNTTSVGRRAKGTPAGSILHRLAAERAADA